MTDASTYSKAPPDGRRWSDRILIAAAGGILFLTLYPFRFSLPAHVADNFFPYLLDGRGKASGWFDALLNVLLFVPLGFGLTAMLRERGKTWVIVLCSALAAGAFFSYAIELAQHYIPGRDSGWLDVFTNSTGSVIGFLAFALCGAAVLRWLWAGEKFLTAFLTAQRAPWILVAYFGLWFAVSVFYQRETRLVDWSPDALLVVGNGASGRPDSAWKGEISRLDFWDHALSSETVQNLRSDRSGGSIDPPPRASYEFSDSSSLQDRQKSAPDLAWTPKAPKASTSGALILDGEAWLTSRSPVTTLVNDFQETRRFSVHIVCKPTQSGGMDARIVSISRPSGQANLEIRQENAGLVFWFRTPLTVKRPRLAWTIPDVFAANQARDILFSYDGSTLTVHLDGKEGFRAYPLGPGTGLARSFRRSKQGELEGYQYIFYALVFLPGGCLVGLAGINLTAQPMGRATVTAFELLTPALLLEVILVHVSGRPVSFCNVVLAIGLALAGNLWMNADIGAVRPSSVSTHNAFSE